MSWEEAGIQDDLGEAQVDVAEALRDMGNSSGDAGLLHLAEEVAKEDDRNQQKSNEGDGDTNQDEENDDENIDASPPKAAKTPEKKGQPKKAATENASAYPPLPDELSHLEPLDIFSQGFLKFLVGMKVYTASDFLTRDLNSFVRPYEEWRLSLNPYTSLTPGSARDYVLRWRKRVSEHIQSLGVSTKDELGRTKDYVVASPSFIMVGYTTTKKSRKSEGTEKQKFQPVVSRPRASNTSSSLPSHLAGMKQLDLLTHGILQFLLHIKVYTASEFLLESSSKFTGLYEEWRTARNPNASITPGSARDFINKWRKRIRQHLAALGVDVDRDLGKKVDYVIASPDPSSSARGPSTTPATKTTSSYSPKKAVKNPRYSLPTPRPVSYAPQPNETKFVSLTLNEPGTFGLKVENTPSNGVRISEVLSGLQGERAGFQKGDIIASATLDTTNFEPDLSKLWGQDMVFDDFVRVAQSQIRPIIVRVRRGGYISPVLTASPASSRKRGRPRKPEKELKKRRRGESAPLPMVRMGPSADSIRRFEINRLRVMREEIIRADSLRSIADDFDKALVNALKHNPLAVIKAKDMSQSMREEFQEIWNNSSHGQWEENLKTLLEFKQIHGHVDVPDNHPDKTLLRFMRDMQTVNNSLRSVKQKDVRNRDRSRMEVEILNKIGFKWKDQDKNWEEGFKELEEYRNKHGSLFIPKDKRTGEYAGLHKWILLQRRKYNNMKKGNIYRLKPSEKLHEDQIKRLNDIGFPWKKTEERSWDNYFEELLEFKLKNGHCNIPAKKFRRLATWANQMRDLKVKRDAGENVEVLTNERVKMLNYFGFNWEKKKNQSVGHDEDKPNSEEGTGNGEGQANDEESDAEEQEGDDDEVVEETNSDVETYKNATLSIGGQTSTKNEAYETMENGDDDVNNNADATKSGVENDEGDGKSSSNTAQKEKSPQDALSERLEL